MKSFLEKLSSPCVILYSVFFIFFIFHNLYASEKSCFKEDAAIRWEGNIHRTTFAGPPNYENIKKGDKPETYWILELPKPICIADEKSIRSLQLIVDPAIYKNKNLLKEKVRVEGTLLPQITGHHHTPFLIDVKLIVRMN